MQNQNGKASAAHIKILPKSIGFMARLRRLVADSGPNKNDQAIVAITVCIGERVDTTGAICETLGRLGFKTSHAAAILKSNTGANSAGYRWSRDEAGHHHLPT